MNTSAVIAELKQIQAANSEGLLKPSEVVAFAQNPKTELHRHFEWDNSKAAESYRIDQARDLIQRVWVTVVDVPKTIHRAYVSLLPDRTLPGGGYRDLEGVMASPALTQSYIQTALAEFRALQRKYKSVEALAPIFAAMDKVEQRIAKKKPLAKAAPARV